jgi:hypothetical protein
VNTPSTTPLSTDPSLVSASKILSLGIIGCIALMAIVLLVGPYSADIKFAEDQGNFWYYWKLPDPTFWTRLTAWGGYAAHQLTIWSLIYLAQSQSRKYVSGLNSFNIMALSANAFFVLLHIGQTKIWYDGLAQDTSILSSFGSVVLMLIFIIMMENQRRGLVFGKRAPFLKEVGIFLRKYHGYYFSWAIIYTFWYHPIEITVGHLLGTLYTLLLILQGSLFFTRSHTNRWWTLSLELFAIVHGCLVALVTHADKQGPETAARFLFGFGVIFIVTQMHGVAFKNWHRWAFAIAMVSSMAWFYQGRWEIIFGIMRIPLVDYLSIFVLALLIWLVFLLPGKLRRKFSRS